MECRIRRKFASDRGKIAVKGFGVVESSYKVSGLNCIPEAQSHKTRRYREYTSRRCMQNCIIHPTTWNQWEHTDDVQKLRFQCTFLNILRINNIVTLRVFNLSKSQKIT